MSGTPSPKKRVERKDASNPNARLGKLDPDRLLDDAGAGIFLLDQKGAFLRTNQAMCRRMLYDPGELKGVPALRLIHAEDAKEARQVIEDLVGGQRAEYRRQIRYLRKDGSIFWADMLLTPVFGEGGECVALAGIVIDISAQKKAEDALRASEARYRRVFQKTGAASIIIEEDMSISMANEEFSKLIGCPRQEIENRMKWPEFIFPDDVERMKGYHRQRRMPGGHAPGEYECRMINRAGQVRDIYMKVGMLPAGKRSIASFMDITSIKQAERAMAKSEAKLSAIIEAAQGYIYTCDRRFRITFMNRSLAEKLGGDATGRLCYRAFHGFSDPCPWCSAPRVFEGETDRQEYQSPVDQRWYEAICSPICDPDGQVEKLEALVLDITDRKSAEKALEERAAYFREENIRLKSSLRERFRFGEIVGKSAPMQAVYERILNAAATEANVIVTGESGTGKELVARAIHDASARKGDGFVVVNCGAIPETLLESEFFGYRKGAFTGADRDKHGYLDLADRGTLFLDELGEIGLNMQVKLLRVIEGKGYIPVGGSEMRHPDIRIVAATNRDTGELLQGGRMREDFYYRIHVIPIHLPPLRERKEDLPLLIEHFLRRFSTKTAPPTVTGKILDAAFAYDWPGNVRELENTLYRFVTLGRFEIMKPAGKRPVRPTARSESPAKGPAGDLRTVVAGFERDRILQALEAARWHRGESAEALGINRRTLFKKIKQYGLDRS